ncbi:hypothetical protein IQ249_04415 [Lusitaniella coriacea LEGE 07157]|uniref:Uncharacterized protein n=2 Tax=Lusitaniella TaxID=1983104 RepID=A0A8J7AX36_9CYAN|nr:hypothetical protein [Lusitaniella coriacea LEGE 07157]
MSEFNKKNKTMTDDSSSKSDYSHLTKEQCLELVSSLFQRERSDRIEKATEAFKKIHPNASKEMIHTLVFHVFVDGTRAALDWLAGAEILLREQDDTELYGHTIHLLYHLYNWYQFKKLAPLETEKIPGILKEMKEAVANNDLEWVQNSIEELEGIYEGEWDAENYT